MVSPPVLTTPACTPVLYKTPRIPLDHPHLRHSQWGCMLMTLSIFQKTQWSKHYSSVLYANGLQSILWCLVEWFLGIHFSWQITKSTVDVHMNQSGFAANLIKQFCRDKWERTSDATPYRSGIPNDLIAPSTDADNSPAQLWRTDSYQSLVGSIGWLAGATRPDIAPVHSFLSSYSNKPAPGHMKAALYALHYVLSTYDYRITFTSSVTSPIHTYVHFLAPLDVEA
jgi:hypothetical protein